MQREGASEGREGGECCVIHGEFYRFRKMSPPITVHNHLGVADTVAGNTTSLLYFTFPRFHSPTRHLPSPHGNAERMTKK